jgi:hypothetical protein
VRETKFYRQRTAKLYQHEEEFLLSGKAGSMAWANASGDAEFDFVVSSSKNMFKRRKIGMRNTQRTKINMKEDLYELGQFQITYNFSSDVRNNIFVRKKSGEDAEYGASGISFRLLYEMLCGRFNNGVYFIDTYFEKIFQTRPVYERFRKLHGTIQDEINVEMTTRVESEADGELVSEKAGEYIADFDVWKKESLYRNCSELAEEIRHDIVVCLSTGRLPLRGEENQKVKPSTERTRKQFYGMESVDRLFYASGQLINHLNIFVEIGEAA